MINQSAKNKQKILTEITNDGITGEITMNMKNVLVQIAVTYIAMIGVGNAAPPELEPISVEVINPLQVTVVEEPTIRVPYQGNADCEVSSGDTTCYDKILPPEDYPDGTNVFVFQSLSLNQASDVNNTLFGFQMRTYYRGRSYAYALPYETGGPLWAEPGESVDGSRRVHNEIVHIYHDGDNNGGSSEPASLIYWFSEEAGTQNSHHRVYFTGYFTYLP